MIIIESLFMGVFATLFMDIIAAFLSKRKLMYSFIDTESIGRWFLYNFKGTFTHKDIKQTPPLKNEKLWCFISHYLIGIILAGLYLLVETKMPAIGNNSWIVFVYGVATVFFPWFWLLPSIGIGFMASKSQKRKLILKTNLLNHTMFGMGMYIWIIFAHHFFI